jgi:hypothetical protein
VLFYTVFTSSRIDLFLLAIDRSPTFLRVPIELISGIETTKNTVFMRKGSFLLILAAFIVYACAPAEKSPSVDFEKEKAAIIAVLEGESEAFWKKDFEKYASYWVHADHIRTAGWWEAGGVTIVEGWDERARRTKEYMAQSPELNATATQVRRENINLRIFNDVAWMTFDQYGEDTGDTLMDMPGRSRETRIFEKVDGEWKIAYLGWLLEGKR